MYPVRHTSPPCPLQSSLSEDPVPGDALHAHPSPRLPPSTAWIALASAHPSLRLHSLITYKQQNSKQEIILIIFFLQPFILMGENKSVTMSTKPRGKTSQSHVLWKIRGPESQNATSWLSFHPGQLGTEEEMGTNAALTAESSRNSPAQLVYLCSQVPQLTFHRSIPYPSPSCW